MGVNKVVYDGNTIIDISDSTATENDVLSGVSFYDKAGVKKSGALVVEDNSAEIALQAEIIDDIWTALTAKYPDHYPDGAFRVVRALTAGKAYVLGFSYGGTNYYLTDQAFNDWTVKAANLTVQDQTGYVFLSGSPTRFTAAASGDGFTLTAAAGSITGMAESYGTELKVNTADATVFTVDLSETGGFSSGTYEPKADERAVWIRAALGGQNCCLKFESGNVSVGLDYAGRDATYSTGFIPFVLYEYCGGEAMA